LEKNGEVYFLDGFLDLSGNVSGIMELEFKLGIVIYF
jgi:hypothetical protein